MKKSSPFFSFKYSFVTGFPYNFISIAKCPYPKLIFWFRLLVNLKYYLLPWQGHGHRHGTMGDGGQKRKAFNADTAHSCHLKPKPKHTGGEWGWWGRGSLGRWVDAEKEERQWRGRRGQKADRQSALSYSFHTIPTDPLSFLTPMNCLGLTPTPPKAPHLFSYTWK